jgi:hypothetical protein
MQKEDTLFIGCPEIAAFIQREYQVRIDQSSIARAAAKLRKDKERKRFHIYTLAEVKEIIALMPRLKRRISARKDATPETK